jgi:murein DD-endopeptidase MepM/ murein hydrolase activator NlpD
MRRSVPEARGGQTRPRPRTWRRAFGIFLIVTLLGGTLLSLGPGATSADELSDAYRKQKQLQELIKKQKAQIANLAASQRSLSSKISSTRASLSELNANLQVVKTQIVAMVVEVAKAQATIDELVAEGSRLDADLADLEAEQAAKQAELDARKALLAERIRESYETDRTSLLESFLAGADFADVLTEVGYHLDFAGEDKVLADQIVADQGVLAVLQQNVELARHETEELHALADQQKGILDGQLAELADARRELARLEAETKRLLAQQQAAYARLAADKAALAKKLTANQEAQRKLEALINRLVREALRKGGIPSAYSGTFDWPMSGTITQEFGCTGFFMEPPLGNCRHFHRGIDIAAAAGTQIRAAGPGKVIFAGKSPYDPAYIVIIAHSSSLVTWYGHVQKQIPVRAGQYVATGEVIAYEGCTGWCTGPHLHWAVQLNGSWVNPRLFLPR